MKYNPKKHHRRSIRLKRYDYSQPGGYFITICTHKRACLFGQIKNDIMILNSFGKIVEHCWYAIPEHFPNTRLDEFIIMPNHVHGIIWIVNHSTPQASPNNVGAMHASPLRGRPCGSKSGSIGAIIGSFKSAVTKRINELRRSPGSPLWQRNYYEHIIRNEMELIRIRRYIVQNPSKWDQDRNHPSYF